jgi:predicted Rdx family selenoprotein
MTQAKIIRCPNSATIRSYTSEVAATLLGHDVRVEIVDGREGEFAILVDGRLIFTRKTEDFPPVERVEAAVYEAGTVGLAI